MIDTQGPVQYNTSVWQRLRTGIHSPEDLFIDRYTVWNAVRIAGYTLISDADLIAPRNGFDADNGNNDF